MPIIRKHIVRNMQEKKLRTLIMIMTVMLATMIIFIGLSLNQVLQDTYSEISRGTYGTGNVLITKAQTEDTPFYKTDAIQTTDKAIEARIDQLQMKGSALVDDTRTDVHFVGMDLDQAQQMTLIDPLSEAEQVPSLTDNQIMISHKTAALYDLAVGDEVTITLDDDRESVTIGAISKTTGTYYGEINDVIFVVIPEFLQNRTRTEPIWTQTMLQVDPGNLEQTITSLADDLPTFDVERTTSKADFRDQETFQTTLFFAIMIIVLISAYVIFSLSRLIIAERLPTVGTFRSLGTSKKKMNMILIGEFLCYGLIGTLLGVMAGVILLPYVADMFNEYKAFGIQASVHYPIAYLLIAIVFGVLFPAVVSLFHVLLTGKKALKDLILQTQDTQAKQASLPRYIGLFLLFASFVLYFMNRTDGMLLGLLSVLSLFVAIVLLIPLFLQGLSFVGSRMLRRSTKGDLVLAIKNMAHNKTVANNCSMIMIVFLLLLMVGMTSTGIDHYLKNTLSQDYDLSITDLSETHATLERLEDVSGVQDYDVQKIGIAHYQMAGHEGDFSVVGVDDFHEFDAFYSGVTFHESALNDIEKQSDGVIIDAYQAKRYQLEIGDMFTLQALDEQFQPTQESPIDVVLAGIMESASLAQNRETVLIHNDFFAMHFSDDFGRIAVKVSDSSDVDTVKASIAKTYLDDDITIETFQALIDSQKGAIDTLISGVTVIIFMGFVVGLLGITNNLIVSFIQRKKEYALLHAICMQKQQLIKMILYEMIATFVAVVVIGLLGGMALNIVMTKMLYGIGLRLDFSFHSGLYIILCCAVLALLLLSTLPVIKRVKTMNVLQELRYE